MKSRVWDKLTTEKRKQACNEWCCPCNDGYTGCYANDFYEMLCDNSTLTYLHSGEEDLFDRLAEEAYNKMIESYDNLEMYEEFCEKYVEELKPRNFWEEYVKCYEDDIKRLEEPYYTLGD